jgi:hypothetical protein
MEFSTAWRKAKPIIEAVQAGGVLLAGIGLIFTAVQLHDNRTAESAVVGLQFEDKFNKSSAMRIVAAIEADPPKSILKEHGGLSDAAALDDFIGDYDTLYYMHKEKLINDEMVYNIFCSYIEDAYANAEIKAHLRDERTAANDPELDAGFDRMAAICNSWDKNGRGKRLSR